MAAEAALIVQFLDAALRLSSGLRRLCTEIRVVPLRFETLRADLERQIELIQFVRRESQPEFASATLPPTLDISLHEYIALANEFNNTLNGMLAKRSGGYLQHVWKDFCSVQRKEEVSHMCHRLEQKRDDLNMWLSAANLKNSSQTLADIHHIRPVSERTLTVANKVENSLSETAADIKRIELQGEQISLAQDKLHSMTEQNTRKILNQEAQLASIHTQLIKERQSKTSTDQISTQILANTEYILQAVRLQSSGTTEFSFSRQIKPNAQNNGATGTHQPHSGFVETAQTLSSDCVGLAAFNDSPARMVTTLVRDSTTNELHEKHTTPLRQAYAQMAATYEEEFGFGIGLNNWLIKKLFLLPKIVVGTHRLVDSTVSPAFCAIKFAREELYNRGSHHITIPTLERNLRYLFEEGRASPRDTDHQGRTLLNEVLWMYISQQVQVSEPGEEYVPLIKFLLEKEADPNISSLSAAEEASDRYADVGGTSLDQFAGLLRQNNAAYRWNVPAATQARSMTILKALIDANAEFSKPFNTLDRIVPCLWPSLFLDQVEEFKAFDQQIEICELGELVPLILQRDLSRFQKTVNSAGLSMLDYRSPRNGLRPIHFAVLWPAALRILIARGVDVNVEDNHGRRPIHLAVALRLPVAVECLFEADCALFTPDWHRSLLQQCLINTSETQKMLDMVVKALIDRHTRLLNIATEYLPGSSFFKLSIPEGQINETSAPRIIEMLISHGIDVPEALVLDGKSVYDFADFHGSTVLNPDIATTFWNAGFRDIDVPSEEGATPYLQSWFCANFEMVKWFVKKGISLTSTHSHTLLTALHFYAERIDYPGGYFNHNLNNLHTDKDIMARINEELGVPHDKCSCPCSPNGCTPVKIFSDIIDLEGPSRKDKFRKWLEDVQPKQSLVNQYILAFTRCLLFEFLGGEHSCCRIGKTCQVENPGVWIPRKHLRSIQDTPGKQLDERWNRSTDHLTYCVDGLPIPTAYPADSPEEVEEIAEMLDSCMSQYDEMPQRETMDPEEQPFEYVKWAILEHHLEVDVNFYCNDCQRDIPCGNK
ncbi:MAG: hypothetical protein Q9195_004862 [Heterodermia aff. obscurata]